MGVKLIFEFFFEFSFSLLGGSKRGLFLYEAILILRRDIVIGFELLGRPKRLQVDFMTISGWILTSFFV